MGDRIFKYTLSLTGLQFVVMPAGATLLTAQMQHGSPQLWAIVDDDRDDEIRSIAIYGTGQSIPEEHSGAYLGTFQMDDGALVLHVFESTQATS